LGLAGKAPYQRTSSFRPASANGTFVCGGSMHYQQQVYEAISAMSGQRHILTIPLLFVKMTKSHRAALALSQAIYWSDRGRDPDGWFYKSYREWKDELGIPRGAMARCIGKLRDAGLIETRISKVGGAPTMHYRVNRDKLVSAVLDCIEMKQSDCPETIQSIVPKTGSLHSIDYLQKATTA